MINRIKCCPQFLFISCYEVKKYLIFTFSYKETVCVARESCQCLSVSKEGFWKIYTYALLFDGNKIRSSYLEFGHSLYILNSASDIFFRSDQGKEIYSPIIKTIAWSSTFFVFYISSINFFPLKAMLDYFDLFNDLLDKMLLYIWFSLNNLLKS